MCAPPFNKFHCNIQLVSKCPKTVQFCKKIIALCESEGSYIIVIINSLKQQKMGELINRRTKWDKSVFAFETYLNL